jgi:hypothetical protein
MCTSSTLSAIWKLPFFSSHSVSVPPLAFSTTLSPDVT